MTICGLIISALLRMKPMMTSEINLARRIMVFIMESM